MAKRFSTSINSLAWGITWIVLAGCTRSEPNTPKPPQYVPAANAQDYPASGVIQNVEVDQSKAKTILADATRVIQSEHYAVFDFGARPVGADDSPSSPSTVLRVYMNYFTARRTEAALAMSIERHENAFGPARAVEAPAAMETSTEVARHPEYANFVRMNGNPEELLIGIGINPQPIGDSDDPVSIRRIVVVDYHTANTLLKQLSEVISKYEAEHGRIETDIQKRYRGDDLQ
jgi:hypothetical protein